MTAAILFDFNGVIVDDEPQHCEALIATLGEDGYALDRDTYYREYLGFDDRECFRFTFERMGRPADEPALLQAIERKNLHYERAIRDSMRLVPGAEEFIESAALDGFQLAIVSGALRREIELVLNLSGLIEDSLPGLAAARAAGLRCAMLSTSHGEEACVGADLVWADFTGHQPADLPWAHA